MTVNEKYAGLLTAISCVERDFLCDRGLTKISRVNARTATTTTPRKSMGQRKREENRDGASK